MKVPVRGPGRPRKWKGPTDVITLRLPLEIIKSIDDIAAETGKSRTDVIVSLVKAASNVQVAKLLLRIDSLEEALDQLEKEKQALLEEREKLLDRIEKLQFKLETYEKGKAAVSSRSTKIINALVKVIEEGKTFADTMIEIGIEHPQEQLAILKDLFITKDEHGNIADVFYPLKTLRKLQGWVLVKGKEPGMVNYIWSREETLKVAQQLKKANAKKTKVKRVVSPEKAKQEIEQKLSAWVRIYERDLLEGRTKAAMEYLLTVQNEGLRKLIKEYDFGLVEEVVFSNSKFAELFGNSLASLKKKAILEVKA